MIAAPDLGLFKISQQAASLAGSMPKLNIINIAGPASPAIRADFGLQQAISKMIAAPDLGLFKISQQAASLAGSMPKLNIINIAGPAFPAIRADFGLQQAISKMIAAPDLGLFKISAAAAIAAPHQNLLRNIGNLTANIAAPVNLTGMSAAASLADLLLRWREVAESGVGVLRGLAHAAYRAALHLATRSCVATMARSPGSSRPG